ncbi:hypothetical protein [uncultured Enterovirga sp.]|uniref:hypothetical protein n=1 Tax=uncultured Enterovirga sp. TaxID=2026352 RepID=UPI0035C95804
MLGFTQEDGRPSIIASTIKSVVIVGTLSVLAAGWLSSATDNQTLSRLAANASRGVEDPLTTGSISSRANAVKIDPCGPPRR